RDGQPGSTVDELVADGAIVYIPLPADLAGKYQSYTEADLTRLRAAGYPAPMLDIEEGVRRYVESLISPGTPSP
ncbi:MAG: ADP-glyceromanno-heptose 6-epimerase, partial [Casimicrobiaceae bacterium]